MASSVFSMMFSHSKVEMLSAMASEFSGSVCLSSNVAYALRTALGYFLHVWHLEGGVIKELLFMKSNRTLIFLDFII
jgi:hypothetical protein